MGTYKKPKRLTGRATPDPYDLDAQARAEHAQGVVEAMWVDTERQRLVLNSIRNYMRVCKARRGKNRSPLTGRRLSQFSQAGKSAIAERLIIELMEEAIAAGLDPNPFRVIHITIDPRMTLKMLYQEILKRLADDFTAEPGSQGRRVSAEQAKELKGSSKDNIKIFEQRVEEWVDRLGVELIIVDEVQRLISNTGNLSANKARIDTFLTADALDVTKKLQAFLDRGVVPLVFIGDETSERFFELNSQFAARLSKPLELRPLDVSKVRQQKQFFDFCIEYNNQIVQQKATAVETCLTEPLVLTALSMASGGHIGRAARIIQVALPAALERGAVTLEAYDLSNAVRDFAIGLGWVNHDPFGVAPAQVEPQTTVTAGELVGV